VFAEQLHQTEPFGYSIDSQSVGTMADRFDFDIGRHDPSLDAAVDLSADIAEDFLDDLFPWKESSLPVV